MVELCDMSHLYHSTGSNKTNVTLLFFTLRNLELLQAMITEEMVNRLGHAVDVLPTIEYFTYLTSVLRATKQSLDPVARVHELNQEIVQHEVRLHQHAKQHRELYFKWFILKDRPQLMDRPVQTHGRRGKGMTQAVSREPSYNWSVFQEYQTEVKKRNRL
jgi:hypothetical protein